jgi:hypothetical protein
MLIIWKEVSWSIKELGIDNSLGNPTYTPTIPTKEKILDNHRSVLCSFGISTKDEEITELLTILQRESPNS